jgi:hypothetical protein
LLDYASRRQQNGIPLWASIVTSLLFAAALLTASARRFARTDY